MSERDKVKWTIVFILIVGAVSAGAWVERLFGGG